LVSNHGHNHPRGEREEKRHSSQGLDIFTIRCCYISFFFIKEGKVATAAAAAAAASSTTTSAAIMCEILHTQYDSKRE
jgi:hypothetical protein